jgi:hypothetical protein
MNSLIEIALDIVGSPEKMDPLYLDPGSGSFLIQLVIASALGAALVLRTSWGRIKSFFKRDQAENPEDETASLVETESEDEAASKR